MWQQSYVRLFAEHPKSHLTDGRGGIGTLELALSAFWGGGVHRTFEWSLSDWFKSRTSQNNLRSSNLAPTVLSQEVAHLFLKYF